MYHGAAAIFDKTGYLVLAKQADMPVADACRSRESRSVEEVFGALFFSIIIKGVARRINQRLTAGVYIQQETGFYTYGGFPAAIAVFRIAYKTKFNGRLKIGRDKFVFFKMIAGI